MKVHNKVLVFASVVTNAVIEMVVFLSASKIYNSCCLWRTRAARTVGKNCLYLEQRASTLFAWSSGGDCQSCIENETRWCVVCFTFIYNTSICRPFPLY